MCTVYFSGVAGSQFPTLLNSVSIRYHRRLIAKVADHLISGDDLLWGTNVLEEIKFTKLGLAAWSPEKSCKSSLSKAALHVQMFSAPRPVFLSPGLSEKVHIIAS